MKGLRSLHSWMFDYGSPVTIGVFRMVFGAVALINLAMVALHFEAWFTERGFVPVALIERWSGGVWRLSLLENVTNDSVAATFYALTMLAALCTALGLFSRVSSVALLVGLISLHHRNPDILHSGDTLMRAMAFYVALSPSGAACSLDRLIALKAGSAPAVPAQVSLWPQRLVQIQLAVLYFTTVWHKSFGDWWLNGTATWYTSQLEEFHRFWVPAFLDRQPFIAATTYGSLLVELSLATLVFARPMRKWVLLAGIALHAGIEYRMNIPLFGLIITSCYIAHYEGHEVSAWGKRMGEWLGRLRRKLARRPALAAAEEDSVV